MAASGAPKRDPFGAPSGPSWIDVKNVQPEVGVLLVSLVQRVSASTPTNLQPLYLPHIPGGVGMVCHSGRIDAVR